jgi:hypothetical protein
MRIQYKRSEHTPKRCDGEGMQSEMDRQLTATHLLRRERLHYLAELGLLETEDRY